MKNNVQDYYDGNMTFMEIFQIGIKKKITIILTTIIFGIFSIFFTLSIDNIYESKTVVQVKQNNKIQSTSNMNALSSLTGISLGGSNTEVSRVIQVLKSRDFAKHIIAFEDILINLFAVDNYDLATKTVMYNSSIYDEVNSKWVRTPPKNGIQIPTYLEAHYELHKNVISINIIDEQYIEIAVQHKSPLFAKDLLELIITEINKIIRKNDISVAKKSLEFLNQELQNTTQVEIRKSINELIKPNLEMLMLADIDTYYKLEPIDKPFYPETHSYPNRKLLCVIITFFGFVLSYLYVLIQHIFFESNKIRNNLK